LAQAAIDGKPVGPLRVWPGGLAFSRYDKYRFILARSISPSCPARHQLHAQVAPVLDVVLTCRSLGDRHAGERVLAEPEVSQMLLDERGARIFVASDGLWDVLTGKNAAHRVRTVTCSKAAARLRSIAKEQHGRDDITVIVMDALDEPNARIPAAIVSASDSQRSDAASIYQVLILCALSDHLSPALRCASSRLSLLHLFDFLCTLSSCGIPSSLVSNDARSSGGMSCQRVVLTLG
jgi:hypothetical protein